MAGDTITAGDAPQAVKKKARRTSSKTRSIGRPAAQRRIGKTFLIEKTVELLRETPPEKLSLSMAARHAGVHLTLFKYYFTDRTRLLVDVARTLAVSLGERVAAIDTRELPAPERLRIRIDAMSDYFFLNPFYHRLMMEIVGDETDPLATELIRVWMTTTVDIYRGIIDAGVAEGSLRPIDPYLTFVAIMGLCEQYQHAARFVAQTGGDSKHKREETAAQYKAFIYDLMLHGIGTR